MAEESRKGRTNPQAGDTAAGAQVVEHVRREIEAGRLGPGDRLPPERELALKMGVSRPSLRSGLRTLQAMGIITSRRGAGTFIVEGPPHLGKAPLEFLAALHGFTLDQMYEARRMLEVGSAGLAAERATGDHMAGMADELTGMFATLDDPQAFLRHDLGFHRAVPPAPATRSWRRSSGRSPRSSGRPGASTCRASACASRPRPTAGSTTRSAPAARSAPGAR